MTRYTPLWEQAGSYAASVDRRLISASTGGAACTGCAVTAPGGSMTLNVAPGAVIVPTQNNTGSTMCVSDAVEAVVIAAAPGSGLNRIDLVTCHPRANDLDGGSNNDFIFDTVTGVAAASPVAPATPAGQVLLAQVNVAGGSAALAQGNITDARPPMLAPAAEPATTSATTVSRVDLTGEVYVAKAGVNGGAWRKARDVLMCGYYRSAAVNAAGDAVLLFDGLTSDPYGLYNSATGVFTAPVSGKYRITAMVAVNASASGQWVSASLAWGAGGVTQEQAHSSSANVVTVVVAQTYALAAAATFTIHCSASVSLPVTTPALGTSRTVMNVEYLGTG